MQHLGTLIMETERLRLRPLTLADAESMYRNWTSDEEVARYVAWEPHSDIAVTQGLLNRWAEQYQDPSFYNWGIEIKATGEVIGTFTFVSISEKDKLAKLGYCIGKAWWNKGYVTEAGRAIMDFGMDKLGLNRIEAVHEVRNPASGRVMAKLGMTYEGTMRQARLVKGEFVSLALYALLASDRRTETDKKR